MVCVGIVVCFLTEAPWADGPVDDLVDEGLLLLEFLLVAIYQAEVSLKLLQGTSSFHGGVVLATSISLLGLENTVLAWTSICCVLTFSKGMVSSL